MSRPQCLIIDKDEAHSAELAAYCESRGYAVSRAAGTDDLQAIDLPDIDIAFIDSTVGLPAMGELADTALADAELFAMALEDNTELAQACIREGFSLFFQKPFVAASLEPMLDDIAAEIAAQDQSFGEDEEAASMLQFGMMRGASKSMRKLFRTLRKIGPTESSTLIVGESGTGKELVAETLHRLSTRADQPYLTVNCAAIAEQLIESELFGHEKGSFSGAQRLHRGFFEQAAGGTLFLDEITEMSIDVQAKLLRVLESGEVRRVGSTDPMHVDVRIIAATNREPHAAVEEGALREDLYYRLAHITVQVPALRRRGADIGGLAQHFLRQLNERHDTALLFSSAALQRIEAHHWPGNVRQLRHAVERAYILSEDLIEADAIAIDVGDRQETAADISVAFGMSLAECERRIILANLDHYGGNKQETAERLGISLKTLYNRLKDYESASPP